MADMVNHPPHYNKHPSGVECIQITEHMSFCVGNAIKYLWRADEKGADIEDLKKARWYIDREIERRETIPKSKEKTMGWAGGTDICIRAWDEIREFVRKEDRAYCLRVLILALEANGWDNVDEIKTKWPESELAIQLAGGGD